MVQSSLIFVGQRCKGRNYGQRRCCTPWNPCDEGEGDCDGRSDGGKHDADKGCKPGLVCGSNNCRKFGLYYHEKDDCCEKPSSSPTVPPLNIEDSSRNLPLLQNKNNNIVKIETKRCQGRNVDQGKCCTTENPCDEGEGDCESDFECSRSLICGINNCKQFGDVFHPKDDCCVKPTASLVEIVCSSNQCNSQAVKKPRCQGRNVDQGKCCTAGNPCEEGEGDCEDDFECSGSLVCGNNNCKQFGNIFHPKDDCCVKPSFVSSSRPASSVDIPTEPKPGQRCAGRNYNGRRCCTPENPCNEGEGDCDGPGDGGQHDGHQGCKPGLVCGSNNCRKFGLYYHEKDDCCEKPSSTPSDPPLKLPLGVWTEPPQGISIFWHLKIL